MLTISHNLRYITGTLTELLGEISNYMTHASPPQLSAEAPRGQLGGGRGRRPRQEAPGLRGPQGELERIAGGVPDAGKGQVGHQGELANGTVMLKYLLFTIYTLLSPVFSTRATPAWCA